MCNLKVLAQQEGSLCQSVPKPCAGQSPPSPNKSSKSGRRRNRGCKPTEEQAAVATPVKEETSPVCCADDDQATATPGSSAELSENTSPSPPPSPPVAVYAEAKIVYALAKLLSHMATASKPPATPCYKSNRFQSVRAPQVSLTSYASRIRKFFRCTDECFVLCLVYIDRIVKLHPDMQVTDLTCHRLLLIGTMVAAKFHDDEYASNAYFAKVGGIETVELNAMEAKFMELINWRLYVKASDYDWYLKALRGIP